MRKVAQGFAVLAAIAAGALFAHCDDGTKVPPTPPENRCEIDLTPFTSKVGASAKARKIEDAKDLFTGDSTAGRLGDYLLENDKLRAIVQAPDRHLQPNPYGGNLIDLVQAGPSATDSFGKLGIFYNFGRTQRATAVSVLSTGEGGGSAVLVADGRDALNDFINLKAMIGSVVPGKTIGIDPDLDIPFAISTYYVLNPGEARVRVVTAFCNEGTKAIDLPVGDLLDSGGEVEFFTPGSCTGGYGYSGSFSCAVGDVSWYGFDGKGVAYGYAPLLPGSATEPTLHSGALTVAGVVATLLGATKTRSPIDALLDYTDPNIKVHDGTLAIPAGGKNFVVRDVVVGRELGEVASLIATYRNDALKLPMGDVGGLVKAGGVPAAGARVALEQDVPQAAGGTKRIVQTTFTTAADGTWSGHLPAAEYYVSAWAPGTAPTDRVALTVQASGKATKDFELAAPRKLTVQVKDLAGEPMPAKVTVLCETLPCPTTHASLVRFIDTVKDELPDNVAAMDTVDTSGTRTFALPAGKYRLVVSRGPSWTFFPPTWKPSSIDVSTAHPVDLTAADATVSAVLGKVIDHPGWISGDFHVHAVNSPDAYAANRDRVVTFMAEGVDVLVATDHDYVTDFVPVIKDLKGEKFLATVPGEEVTTFDYGHTNLFPMKRDENDLTGGAVDWGNGEKECLTQREINAAGRARGAGTVQINHPRGAQGLFSAHLLDTDTGATHSDPKTNRLPPQPGATAADTKLMSFDFNVMEILNGNGSDYGGISAYGGERGRALMNDWFSFLSRGAVVGATGVSDTHIRWANAAGYWRTWVHSGASGPSDFDAQKFSEAINQLKIVPTNGPFVQYTAHAVDGAGQPAGADVETGGVLAPGGSAFELVVDVQVPAWMRVDKIEILGHVAGGDVPCADGFSPKTTPKSRVACNGDANPNWPAEGVAASFKLATGDAETVTVAEKDGVSYQRLHIRKAFPMPAPTGDTWYVAAVYGVGSMFPLVYSAITSGRAGEVYPYAITNPIFVDADGGGYDKPPAGTKLGGSGGAGGGPGKLAPTRPRPPPVQERLTPRDLEQLLQRLVRERC